MQTVPLADFNGQTMPLDEVRVSVLDRSFLFGDAVYEALRVYQHKPWLLGSHLDRLTSSLAKVRIETDVARIERRMLALLERSGVDEGIIYLQITRGEAPRTHYFPTVRAVPNELIYVAGYAADPYLAFRESGCSVITTDDLRWGRCDIKTVNLLGNCMAMQTAKEANCTEALLVDERGLITEGSHTNAMGVINGVLHTHPDGPAILPGCTKKFVLELALQLGIPHRDVAIARDQLSTIDELMLTGTTTEVLGITSVDGKPVGNGRVGSVTCRLYDAYRRAVGDWLERGAPRA